MKDILVFSLLSCFHLNTKFIKIQTPANSHCILQTAEASMPCYGVRILQLGMYFIAQLVLEHPK